MLEQLKEKYEQKKIDYGLPTFQEMTEEFEIEKVSEKETEFVLREIRRTILEKVSAYMHLFESIINPSSGSLLIFSVLKNIDEEAKKEIKEIYKKLAKIQIISMRLDTIYNEKEEAEFIIQVYKDWGKLKYPIFKLFEKFDKDFDVPNGSATGCYFG